MADNKDPYHPSALGTPSPYDHPDSRVDLPNSPVKNKEVRDAKTTIDNLKKNYPSDDQFPIKPTGKTPKNGGY